MEAGRPPSRLEALSLILPGEGAFGAYGRLYMDDNVWLLA